MKTTFVKHTQQIGKKKKPGKEMNMVKKQKPSTDASVTVHTFYVHPCGDIFCLFLVPVVIKPPIDFVNKICIALRIPLWRSLSYHFSPLFNSSLGCVNEIT